MKVKKIINEKRKNSWNWVGCELTDAFNDELFYDVDMSFSETDLQVAFHSNLGSITVLDRMTGFGMGMRDIETGFRDMEGKFWLASGGFDVRREGCQTIGDAIACIKRNANNCKGE